jgi:integrase
MAGKGDGVWKVGDRWAFALRLATSERPNRQMKRSGYRTERQAKAARDEVLALVKLARDDERLRRRIGDMIFERSRYGGGLPTEDELRRKLGAGTDPQDVIPTVGEWLDTWLAHMERQVAAGRRKRSTVDTYRADVGRVWWPLLDVRLDLLTDDHVAEALGRANGPAAQHRAFAALRAALNAAGPGRRPLRRHIQFNPCDLVPLPEHDPRPVVIWEPEELARFLAHVEHHPLGDLLRVLALCGLRRGEVIGLRWADLDLDAGLLRVEQQLVWRQGEWTVERPKTRKSRREVGVDVETVAALRAHKVRQAKDRLLAGSAWQDHDLVFCREDGSPIPTWDVNSRFKELCEAARVPVIRLHDLRHTYVSMLDEAGVDIKVASEMVGHSSTRITETVYQHVRRARRADAAARVAALLPGQVSAR